MKCPLCSADVTESDLDSNIRETLKGFSGEKKANPLHMGLPKMRQDTGHHLRDLLTRRRSS